MPSTPRSDLSDVAPSPAAQLRTALVDQLAELLRLYLAGQPRAMRRSIVAAAGALGWSLDRQLAADLVGQLDDDVVGFLVAELYDRASTLLGQAPASVGQLDTTSPELRARAGDQLRAALARVAW